ncbi:MAG: hypothetical protein HBSAPP02_21500 [Phycisphaerae bacterium]|nr:MAG: hypothetical protein HRU71_05715 [Planctomycetia bacterium]GJQ27118.1 MAG: hypothetical protein HBSAPP02_21500 [Phycisphaerae bacterium]
MQARFVTGLRMVYANVLILVACNAAWGQNRATPTAAPLDPAVMNHLKAQARPHEAVREQLLRKFKDLRVDRQYLQAAQVLEEIRKEQDFTPAQPHLMDGGKQELGKIGSLGKATIIDAINDDMAVVTTYFQGREFLVLVRGLAGVTTVCNDCPLELHSVQIKGNEKYDRVIGERRVIGSGVRKDKVTLSQKVESEETSSEAQERIGSRQAGEVEQEETERVSTENAKKKKGQQKSEADQTHEFEEDRVVKLLGPKKELLSVVPIDLSDAVPAVRQYWNDYRAAEKKATDTEASRFYREMVQISTKLRDGKCVVKAKNKTDFLMRDVNVELTSKPARLKPVPLAMSDVAPGRERTKTCDWKIKDAEPSVRIVSLAVEPPPPCADCQDTRLRKCLHCLGTTSISCQACKGSGKRIHVRSKGPSGGATTGHTSELVDCDKCNNGQKTCPACKGQGQVICKKCQKKS